MNTINVYTDPTNREEHAHTKKNTLSTLHKHARGKVIDHYICYHHCQGCWHENHHISRLIFRYIQATYRTAGFFVGFNIYRWLITTILQV